jgi:hypothetical protein
VSGIPYHAWTHRAKEDGGTDPLVGTSIPWIAANGIYDTGGDPIVTPAWDNLWETVWVEPGADSTFEYSTLTNGGYNAADSFGLYINRSGIYTFTFQAITSDLAEAVGYDVYLALELLHTSNAFPNHSAASNTSDGWVSWERSVTPVVGSSGQVMFLNSITTPIYASTTHLKTGRVSIGYSNPTGTGTTWTVQLWIARIGGFTWPGNFATPTDGL